MQFKVNVKNTGKRDGTEVVQIYIRKADDEEGPVKSLRAFRPVTLKAGKSATVNITLSPDTFEFFDPESNVMRVMAGEYEVLYGTSSERKDLKKIKVRIQ